MFRIYISNLLATLRYNRRFRIYSKIHNRFSAFTMIRKFDYADNLELCQKQQSVKGDVVECGVWRGGMIAGIAHLLRDNRTFYLFDSFEGLPEVTERDGSEAKKWQENKTGDTYFNNCKAEMDFAKQAMQLAGTTNYVIEKGWFNDTLPAFNKTSSIAILRLDGDWYESTMCCLTYLYPKVVPGGIIIIDDYYTWDGCTRAVHDYLSKHGLTDRIERTKNGVCYIYKK